MASLKQRVLEGNAGLPKLGLGLSAKFEEQAIAQITSSTQQLALELDAQCSKYNACLLDEARWRDEEQRLREHVRLIEAMQTRPSPAVGDALWANAAPTLAAERLEIAFDVEARRPGGTFASHASGAPLHSGDELRFRVRTNLPAYVYVLLLASQGTPEQLFPSAAMGTKNPLAAEVIVAIPPAQIGVFTLDQTVGREHLQLIASERPIADVEARLAQLAQQPADAGRDALLRSVGELVCEPSGTRGMNLKATSVSCGASSTRGLVLKPEPSQPSALSAAAEVLKAEPNDDVVVLQHEIDHVP